MTNQKVMKWKSARTDGAELLDGGGPRPGAPFPPHALPSGPPCSPLFSPLTASRWAVPRPHGEGSQLPHCPRILGPWALCAPPPRPHPHPHPHPSFLRLPSGLGERRHFRRGKLSELRALCPGRARRGQNAWPAGTGREGELAQPGFIVPGKGIYVGAAPSGLVAHQAHVLPASPPRTEAGLRKSLSTAYPLPAAGF